MSYIDLPLRLREGETEDEAFKYLQDPVKDDDFTIFFHEPEALVDCAHCIHLEGSAVQVWQVMERALEGRYADEIDPDWIIFEGEDGPPESTEIVRGVIRRSSDLPEGKLPKGVDGTTFDFQEMQLNDWHLSVPGASESDSDWLLTATDRTEEIDGVPHRVFEIRAER